MIVSISSYGDTNMVVKNTITDELVNKLYHLTKALNAAESIIETLQEENNNLKDLLSAFNAEEKLLSV